jgi:hypothetical protein
MAFLSGILLAAALAAPQAKTFTHFDNYTKAYAAAQLVDRPMLVILNPGGEAGSDGVRVDELRKTEQRSELLQDYVVCVLDTTTEHGAKCKELFKADALPRVVVIDKKQELQIFRTSERLDEELWTQVLISFRAGVAGPNPIAKAVSQSSPAAATPRRAPIRYSVPCST